MEKTTIALVAKIYAEKYPDTQVMKKQLQTSLLFMENNDYQKTVTIAENIHAEKYGQQAKLEF